jgi:hypothetical protein
MNNVAVLHYESSHGTDTILYLTDETDMTKLPKIDEKLLVQGGVFDPFSDEDESAEWVHILPIAGLPTI